MCDVVATSRISLSDEMRPADDAEDDDEDVAECERDGCEATGRRVGGMPTPASAADAQSSRAARRVAGAGLATTVTTDRDDSGRCGRTTEASEAQTSECSPTTRPRWETGGRYTVGCRIASSTTAQNALGDRQIRRCRGQSRRH